MTLQEADILQHYGIKGMKWGIRRTEAQLQRARGKLDSDRAADKAERARRKQVRKNVRTTSDEDLRKEVNRLELEKKFKSLSNEDLHRGRTAVTKFLKSTGGRVLTSAVVGGLSYAGYAYLRGDVKEAKDLEDMQRRMADYIFPNPNRKK